MELKLFEVVKRELEIRLYKQSLKNFLTFPVISVTSQSQTNGVLRNAQKYSSKCRKKQFFSLI